MISFNFLRNMQVLRRESPLQFYKHLRFSHRVSLDENSSNVIKADLKDLIIYNTVLEKQNRKFLGWGQQRGHQLKMDKLKQTAISESIAQKPDVSVVFKYLSDEYKDKLLKESGVTSSTLLEDKKYAQEEAISVSESGSTNLQQNVKEKAPDFFDLSESDDEGELMLDMMDVGTADPSVAVSKVPCGGCGALLHCQHRNEPGFVPKELFKSVPDKHLRAMICQRCHFLKHYSTALKVNVSPQEYPKILRQIHDKRALVLLIVDLMDFPCSIWPDLCKVIGYKRPVCVVGNKVDLLPADCPSYLNHVAEVLRREVQRITGITDVDLKHVALVSALTGFGIESLITKLHNSWHYKGDVYLVGCTNVGKSSLFNILLNSDLCKVQAIDAVQRATISTWPGTTLNLLKFPMLRPDPVRLAMRTKRLIAERELIQEQEILKKQNLRLTRKIEEATLSAPVGRTFFLPREETKDPFSQKIASTTDYKPEIGLDPHDPDLKESRWCYDTPGTVQPDQVLNLLREEELNLVLPQSILSPETFRVKPGWSLFLAGLGRLDYVRGPQAIMLTVFASRNLPVTMCATEHADELYSQLLATELFVVPFSDEERLADWPGLQPGPELHLEGVNWKFSCGDILLSSAGWITVTMGQGMQCTFQAHTPGARGIHIRQPPLLPKAVNRRGPRIRHSPAYSKFIPLLS